jgi:hypothetical protein
MLTATNRLAYTTTLVTLTVSGAAILPTTQNIAGYLCIPLFLMALFNGFGGVKVRASNITLSDR